MKSKEKAHHQIHRSRGHLQHRCHPTSRHHRGRGCSQRCCKWIFEDVLIQGNNSSCSFKSVKKVVKDFLSEDWKISLLKSEVKSVILHRSNTSIISHSKNHAPAPAHTEVWGHVRLLFDMINCNLALYVVTIRMSLIMKMVMLINLTIYLK